MCFDMTVSSIYSYRFQLSIGAFNPAIYENFEWSSSLIYTRFLQQKRANHVGNNMSNSFVFLFFLTRFWRFGFRVKYKRQQNSKLFVTVVYFIRLNEVLYIMWVRIVTIWNIYDCKCYETRQNTTAPRRNRRREQERHKLRSIKLLLDSTVIIQLSLEFDVTAMRISWLFRILEHEVTGRLHRHRFPVYYRCQRKKKKKKNRK